MTVRSRVPRRGVLAGSALLVAGPWPLLVALAVSRGSLGGWGTGCVATGAWLLVAAITLQIRRARAERRRAAAYPGPAARRHDVSAVVEAMIAAAVAAGHPGWNGLVLVLDDGGRSLTVHRGVDQFGVPEPWDPGLLARVDQLDLAVARHEADRRRLVVRASRSGDASVSVE